jgi:hypothetical protein
MMSPQSVGLDFLVVCGDQFAHASSGGGILHREQPAQHPFGVQPLLGRKRRIGQEHTTDEGGVER